MSKNQILFTISCVLLLATLFLWAGMWWQKTHPPVSPPQIITLPPEIPLLPVPPVPVLNERLGALAVATASATSSPYDLSSSPFSASTSSSATEFPLPPVLPSLSASAALAIDLDTSAILLEKNPHLSLPPASSIKMMTALIAMETYSLDQIITIAPSDLTSSNAINLQAGEQLTVADLIQAMLVNSSNESAQALANHSPQGPSAFIQRMNARAQELHLTDTTFISPEGFDYPEQKTSARDLALLAQALLTDPNLAQIVSLPRTTILAATGEIHELDNTNQFLAHPPTLALADGRRLPATFSGIKTGTTPAAGEVLVTLATVDGRRLLLVVLGSRNRYSDSTTILTWIFNHYTWVDFSGHPR